MASAFLFLPFAAQLNSIFSHLEPFEKFLRNRLILVRKCRRNTRFFEIHKHFNTQVYDAYDTTHDAIVYVLAMTAPTISTRTCVCIAIILTHSICLIQTSNNPSKICPAERIFFKATLLNAGNFEDSFLAWNLFYLSFDGKNVLIWCYFI